MDKNDILFSIVIPAYNEEKMIGGCLESVKKQRVDFSYEIIVVDNNSTDRTAEVARLAGVRVVSETVRGVGRARKTGTEAAQGEYVLHLDADTRLPEDYLINALSKFKKDPNLTCLGGQFYFYDASWWKSVLRFFILYSLKFFAVALFRSKFGPMGNNMSFKKEDYNKTSGFNPALNFCEDADLAKKLSRLGRVKMDMGLKSYVSVRRYRLDLNFLFQLLNLTWFCFFGRPLKNKFEEIK